jgi:hypothetical protein
MSSKLVDKFTEAAFMPSALPISALDSRTVLLSPVPPRRGEGVLQSRQRIQKWLRAYEYSNKSMRKGGGLKSAFVEQFNKGNVQNIGMRSGQTRAMYIVVKALQLAANWLRSMFLCPITLRPPEWVLESRGMKT